MEEGRVIEGRTYSDNCSDIPTARMSRKRHSLSIPIIIRRHHTGIIMTFMYIFYLFRLYVFTSKNYIKKNKCHGCKQVYKVTISLSEIFS